MNNKTQYEVGKSNVVQIIYKYAWKSKKYFMWTLGLMILGSIFSMILPRVTERIINGLEEQTIDLSMILLLLGLAILLGLGSAVITGAGRYASAYVGTKAIYYLRSDVYHAINRQSYSYFDKNEVGQLVARSTSDIDTSSQAFNMGITLSVQATMALIMGILGISIMIPGETTILLIVYGSMVLYLIVIAITTKKMRPVYLKSREVFGDLTTTIRENILGANVVRIFNAQSKEKVKFNDNNAEFKDLTIETVRLQAILRYTGRTIIGVMGVAGLYVAAQKTISGEMGIGTLFALISYIGMLGMPIFMLNGVIINFIAADAALTRVKDVLDSMPEVNEDLEAIAATEITGEIEFNHVDFGYTSNLVLKDITFKVPAGSKIAILGTTGSGKSTLMSLLPRFYDATAGEVLFDGINIRKFKLDGADSIRSQIGTCSQNIFLFNTSIADNIRFGRNDASLDEIIQAAKSANIHEFIETLPDKYDTIIGERGTSLSGGQKQRVAIARALIMEPKILILDDSTSAVDVATEYKIQQAMETIMEGRTSFIITQRLSTIRNADIIFVMDRGKIVGMGVHEDLFSNNPLYRQIFETLNAKQKTLDRKQQIESMEAN